MSVRGNQSRTNSRLPLTTPQKREPELGSREGALEADAEALIATDGERAYRRARDYQARARQTAVRWDLVARLIAQRSDRSIQGAGGGSDCTLAQSPANPAESTQVEELERILGARTARFRLQFFAVATDRGPSILSEAYVEARDVSGAIRASADAVWPPRAIGMRLVDPDGREVYERLKADSR